MIKKLKIEGLFGTQNYEMDFTQECEIMDIVMLTGPNGYGKSTILKIIFFLLNGYLSEFENIDFQRIEAELETGRKCVITKGIETLDEIHVVKLNVDDKEFIFDRIRFENKYLKYEKIIDAMGLGDKRCRYVNLDEIRDSFLLSNNSVITRFMKEDGNPEKIELFNKIIDRLEFLNKKFVIEQDDKYYDLNVIFSNCYKETDLQKALSKGEFNMITMLVRFLFLAKENDLIIVDEPETSIHVAWQVLFRDLLKQIRELNNTRYILGTHSPSIIHGMWKMTIDLYDLERKSKEENEEDE